MKFHIQRIGKADTKIKILDKNMLNPTFAFLNKANKRPKIEPDPTVNKN